MTQERRILILDAIKLATQEINFRNEKITKKRIIHFARQYGHVLKITPKEISQVLNMKLRDIIVGE